MHCEEALLLISGHLDNENTELEEARLQAHLEQCPDCRQVLESFQLMDAGLLSLEEEAPARLHDRVMEAVRKEAAPRRKKNPWMGVLASAAAVALVVGIGWFASDRNADGSMAQDSNEPMTVSLYADTAKDLQVQSLTVRAVDGEAVSQEISAPVVVLDGYVAELDGLPFETLADGSRLYRLETDAAAQELSERYGAALYWPDQGGAKVTYAVSFALVPATP